MYERFNAYVYDHTDGGMKPITPVRYSSDKGMPYMAVHPSLKDVYISKQQAMDFFGLVEAPVATVPAVELTLWDVLYTKKVTSYGVHHVQALTKTKEEAVKLAREEVGQGIYIISIEPHEDGLNEVHPDYW